MVAQRRTAIEQMISELNCKYFEAEAEKLDSWADDLKVALEREIKEMDRQIREARRKRHRPAHSRRNWRVRSRLRPSRRSAPLPRDCRAWPISP